jgi:phage tail-like protein
MTQARSRPVFSPQLTSSQIPDALDRMEQVLDVKIHAQSRKPMPGPLQMGAVTNALLLTPGQTSEITVQMKNATVEPLPWDIEVTDLQKIRQIEYIDPPVLSDISPGETTYASLKFRVSADFFEHAEALDVHQKALQSDARINISVFANLQGTRTLVKDECFYFAVRSPCTYLDFLPEIYRESDFMGRFLMLFEQAFDPDIQTLDTLWAYLDPLTAPKAMLPFLAHWVAWDMEPRWTLKQQRRLMRHAVELYRWRGTRQGLRLFLHLYTDLPLDEDLPEAEKHISIVEDFNRKFVLGDVRFDQNPKLGGGRPYHFSVTLRVQPSASISAPISAPIDESLVREIIERYKPAFCTYDLHL